MPFPFAVPMVQLNELCARARNHYLERQRITDPCWRQEVRHSIPDGSRAPDADGWVHIANLSDRIAGMYYSILWHPETDKLRLDGPRR